MMKIKYSFSFVIDFVSVVWSLWQDWLLDSSRTQIASLFRSPLWWSSVVPLSLLHRFLFFLFSFITPPLLASVPVSQQRRPLEAQTSDDVDSVSGSSLLQLSDEMPVFFFFFFSCLISLVVFSPLWQAALTLSDLRSLSPSPVPPPPLLSPSMLLFLLCRRLPSPNLTPLPQSQVTFPFFCASFFILLHIISHFSRLPCPSSLLSSGAQGAWLTSGADITPVPLLSSPDLDALCDPVAPALAASLPRSSPPHSSSYSTSVLFSSPRPQLVVSPSAPPAPPGTSAGDKLPLSPTVWDSLSDLTFALRRLNVPLQSSGQGDSCELRFRPDQTGAGFKDGHHRKQSWTGKDQVRSCVQCLNLDCLVWLCG